MSKCPFKPMRGRIVCEGTRLVPKAKGKIRIPPNKLTQYMRVAAVGPGRLDKDGKEIKPLVKAGDIVTAISGAPQFAWHNPKDATKPGIEYFIFDEASVLATVDESRLVDGTYTGPKIELPGTH